MPRAFLIYFVGAALMFSCSEPDDTDPSVSLRNLPLSNVEVQIIQPDTSLFTYLLDNVIITSELLIEEVAHSYLLTGYWYNGDGNLLLKVDSINSSNRFSISFPNLSIGIHDIFFEIENSNGETKRTSSIRLYNTPDINLNFLAVGQKSKYSFFKECNSASLREEIQTTLEVKDISGSNYTIEEIWDDRKLVYDLIYDDSSIIIPTSDLDINDQFPSMFAFPKDFSVRDSLRFNLDEVCFIREPNINCNQLNELGFTDRVCEYGQLTIFQETFEKPLVYMFINRAVFSLTLTSNGEIAVAFVVSSMDRPVSADPNGWLLVR